MSLVLFIFSLFAEVAGALMMANGIAGIVRWRQVPGLLLRALFRRPTIEGRLSAELSQEDRAVTLRGLAFLALGFVLQFAGLVLAAFGW